MGHPHQRGHKLLTGLASLTLITGGVLAAAQSPATAASSAPQANPYSPQYQHPYRHGAVPTRAQNAKMKAWAKTHAATLATATGPETLSYGGGIDGIGVQSGHSKVYLVFYGTQWGTKGTDANGNYTFTGDPDHAAPAAQKMFKGIGTNNETWSADLTQWCDGPNVSAGATSCPTNANFIPYQTGGVLAGVWYDNAKASPSKASGHQLGVEAVNAAAHFGNTTAASNRDAYYVILSPHGVNPDDYQNPITGYCAWHDYNGDTTLTGGAVTSPYGDIAFSNQPYNMDLGASCGVGFVNSPGTLDGYTMTLGHEWHEMMSDQNPAGGWTNNTGSSYQGQENSDECAWISPGQPGGAANISFGSFGSYAEQASWSNDTNNCAISHAILH
jgi:serine protease